VTALKKPIPAVNVKNIPAKLVDGLGTNDKPERKGIRELATPAKAKPRAAEESGVKVIPAKKPKHTNKEEE
jgi:hypothetical protein